MISTPETTQTFNAISAAVTTAPDAKSFVEYPASWYPLCKSSDLKNGDKKPKRFKLLGSEFIAFRTSDGKAVLMNAHCSHLGADLGGGCVKNNTIECPYHGWKYDLTGTCVEIPGQASIPASLKITARQTSYPVEERHGLIFFFFGERTLFELPFFFGEDANEYLFGGDFNLELPCPWYMMGSHAFDQKHLELVHSRHLLGPLEVDHPHAYARRGRHTSLVQGGNIFDRLIRFFAGNQVSISMTVFGGTFVMVTGDFKKVRSRFFLMATPNEKGDTELRGLVFSRKSKYSIVNRVFAPLVIGIRAWFTKGYLVNEVAELGRHFYRPQMLVEHDQALIDYYSWAAEMSSTAKKNASF